MLINILLIILSPIILNHFLLSWNRSEVFVGLFSLGFEIRLNLYCFSSETRSLFSLNIVTIYYKNNASALTNCSNCVCLSGIFCSELYPKAILMIRCLQAYLDFYIVIFTQNVLIQINSSCIHERMYSVSRIRHIKVCFNRIFVLKFLLEQHDTLVLFLNK